MGADSSVLAELYRRYAPAVFRRARSLLSDEQEAHDVTQDVFLGYLKHRERARGEASPFTVLYQMATYQAVDRLRRRSRWSGRLQSLDVDEESDSLGLEVAADDGGTRRVEAAQDLALLTHGEDEQTLTLAVLCLVEGYTAEQAAQTLDVSRKTVGRALKAFSERANKRAQRFKVGGA